MNRVCIPHPQQSKEGNSQDSYRNLTDFRKQINYSIFYDSKCGYCVMKINMRMQDYYHI